MSNKSSVRFEVQESTACDDCDINPAREDDADERDGRLVCRGCRGNAANQPERNAIG